LDSPVKEVEEQNEVIGITKHGRIIAIISPAPQENPIALAIESIRKNRKGVYLGKDLTLKELIEEGRK